MEPRVTARDRSEPEQELEPEPADEKVHEDSGQGKCHPADMGGALNTKTDNYLAKLSGVLDPNRVPTIPFSTRLGPVPVRVPTCILISLLHYSLTLTNPASVGSIGDREIKKFSDFPSFHLLHFALGLNTSGPKTEGNVST